MRINFKIENENQVLCFANGEGCVCDLKDVEKYLVLDNSPFITLYHNESTIGLVKSSIIELIQVQGLQFRINIDRAIFICDEIQIDFDNHLNECAIYKVMDEIEGCIRFFYTITEAQKFANRYGIKTIKKEIVRL